MSFNKVWVTKLPQADLKSSPVPVQPLEMRTNLLCISSHRIQLSKEGFSWEVVHVAVVMMASLSCLMKLSSW